MRWRAITAASLVFAGLLAWVLTQEKGRVPETDEVFGIDIKTITAMRIERKDEEPLVLQRRGEDDWRITEPFEGMADVEDVERMLKAVAELKPKSFRDVVDPAAEQFGLDKPDLVAIVTWGGGKTARLEVGGETAMGSDRFARVTGARDSSDDEKLLIVGAMVRTNLWKDPEDLREKKVAKFETEEVQRVTLDHGDEHVVAVREPGDGDEIAWRLTEPLKTPADEWNVKQLVNKVRDLKAEDFLPEDADQEGLGFDEPQATVRLAMADGRNLTITFGATDSREVGDPAEEKEIIYVRSSERGEVLMVKAEELDKVQKTAFDLRDKTIVRFERKDVTRIRVERTKGASFTVGRRPDGWRLEKPEVFDTAEGPISDILWELENLSASKFVTESASQQELRTYGLAVPQAAITIELAGDREPIKVLVGSETSEGNYYCKTADSDQVVEISKFLLEKLPEDVEELKKEAEPELPADDVGDEDVTDLPEGED